MFCSIIIPTIGRSTLERAVLSVLEQDFNQSDFEVIVVNDSGKPLAMASWQESSRVRILNTNRRERSIARNSGAAIARGEYLAFLDDDDWFLPGAFNQFWQLAVQEKEAGWLYGGIRIEDYHERVLGEINSGLNGACFAQMMGGATAPLQASMVKAEAFFLAGGFNPLIWGEDEDLCRRIAYDWNFANTSSVLACLFRGESWKTSTNYLRAAADTKVSRNRILSAPSAFNRLIASTGSPYWAGRICRIYLSTVVWNLQHRYVWTAVSRVFFTLAGILRHIRFITSKEFYRGLKAEHVPESLHFVMQKYEQGKVYQVGDGL